MYVDFPYYQKEYGGTMPEEAFPPAVRRAEAYISYLTSLNGDIFSVQSDAVKQAVCAAADIYYTDMQEKVRRAAEGREGAVKSENNDGYSVSYVTEQMDGQTAEELLKKKVYEAVYIYLVPTGWLSRRVRRGHDNKCGHHHL